MEYLFLRRKKTSSTSVRQKTLLYRAAGRDALNVLLLDAGDVDIFCDVLGQRP